MYISQKVLRNPTGGLVIWLRCVAKKLAFSSNLNMQYISVYNSILKTYNLDSAFYLIHPSNVGISSPDPRKETTPVVSPENLFTGYASAESHFVFFPPA